MLVALVAPGLVLHSQGCTWDQSLCWCHHPGTRMDKGHMGQDPGGQGLSSSPGQSSGGCAKWLLWLCWVMSWTCMCVQGVCS